MKQLTIAWCKDFKNCVPFYVRLNGNDIGIIKRGEQIQCQLVNDDFELFLVPKGSELLGWKALRIHGKSHNTGNSLIELSILYKGKSIINSQLHINRIENVTVFSEELCKKGIKMKICKKCNHTFDDSAGFCPDCGEKLQIIRYEEPKKTPKFLEAIKNKSEEYDNSSKTVARYFAAIISIIGFIVAMYIYTEIGFAFSIVGILCGAFSKNTVNRVVSILLGIITILLCFIVGF